MRRRHLTNGGGKPAVCDVSDTVMFELPHSLDAPADARVLVEQNLCPVHGLAARGPALVLVSELALCAVIYGKPPIVLDLACGETQVRVAVTHRAAGSMVPEIPVDEEGGLRTPVLTRLTRSWGVDRGPEARTLWCALSAGTVPPQRAGSAMPLRDRHAV